MSQQRFIRCTHCGLPHEAEESTCPVTGARIELSKPRRRPSPPPSEEDYAWAHDVRNPRRRAQVLDPDDLIGFVGRSVEEALILRSLSREAAERPASAAQMLEAMREAARDAREAALAERYPSFDDDGAGDATIREQPLSDDATAVFEDPPARDDGST